MGLVYSSVVTAELADVFDWHTRQGAASRLIPPWQPVRVLREAKSLRDGQAIFGLSAGLHWVATHQPAAYDPPYQFVDTLTSFPLSTVLTWRHVHQFSVEDEHTTRITDQVDTPLPAAMLRPMFAYRHRQLADELAAQVRARELCSDALTVAVTGSSGLIGTALTAFLTSGGHQVIRLVRHMPRHADERLWRPQAPNPKLLDGVDAVIHLAGASIAGRFTEAHKKKLHDSRIGPTRKLAELASQSNQLRAFVTASAIGLYGPNRGNEILTETSSRGEGFLADLVTAWEDASTPAAEAGIRTVQVRTGIVQTPRGGTLRLFYPLFAAGLGGRLGNGEQWLSWIGLDDLLDIYLRAVLDSKLSGPINAVAPTPLRNTDYTHTLARVLHRPALLPVPAFGPQLLLGAEGNRELALANQRVQPQRLLDVGHHFRYSELDQALRHLLGR